MNNYFTLSAITFIMCYPLHAQVGINTPDPKATLDVNGNLKVRKVPEEVYSPDKFNIMTLNKSSSEVSQLSPKVLFKNKTICSAKLENSLTIASIDWNKLNRIPFKSNNVSIGMPSLISDNENSYITPSEGIYQINYHLRLETSASFSPNLLAQIPFLEIRKNNSEIIERRTIEKIPQQSLHGAFGAYYIDTTISTIAYLETGDKISFQYFLPGFNLNIVSTSIASFNIYRISN